jgi:hypothetical protein
MRLNTMLEKVENKIKFQKWKLEKKIGFDESVGQFTLNPSLPFSDEKLKIKMNFQKFFSATQSPVL